MALIVGITIDEYERIMMKKQKLPKLKKGAWFYKVRGSYLPATWQGWATYLPFIWFLIWSWTLAFHKYDTYAVALLVTFPAWIAAAVVMTWVASKKS